MNLVVLILMVLTLLVVLGGVALMMRGGKWNKEYGNKLMILRVGLQGLVVVIIFIAAVFFGKG